MLSFVYVYYVNKNIGNGYYLIPLGIQTIQFLDGKLFDISKST